MNLSTCRKLPLISVVLGVMGFSQVVQARSIEDLHDNLVRAVCLNDWRGAIALVNPLIASPDLTDTYRQSLVDLREQLADFAQLGTTVPDVERCEAVLRRYVPASEIPVNSSPLDWPAAVAYISKAQDTRSPRTQAAGQQEALVVADLDTLDIYDVPALSPALFVDMQTGSGVSAGVVSNNEQIHTFFGGLGDRVTIDVDVTRVLPGAIAQNDDTQLFLFDATGTLIAANNDADGLQSKLEDILLPRTGRYYVAVTTYDNSPSLDEANRILGWTFGGESSVEYTLTIRGVTPSRELILTNYGLE